MFDCICVNVGELTAGLVKRLLVVLGSVCAFREVGQGGVCYLVRCKSKAIPTENVPGDFFVQRNHLLHPYAIFEKYMLAPFMGKPPKHRN